MIGNSSLMIAASISLGIHLLFLGIVSNLSHDPKLPRMPVHYVTVTIQPMVATVTREEPPRKITLPVPLKVGEQAPEGPASDQEGRHGETVFPSESMAKDTPSEEPKTSLQQPEEERTLEEPINVMVAEELPSGSTLGKEENPLSSQATGSNGGHQSISLPSLRSGESSGDGFAFANAGGGSGVGKTFGDGSPNKAGSGNSAKGKGILGKFFFAHGGGNGSQPSYADNPKPIYPQEAKEKGYEGEVVLRVEVLVNGRVGQIEIKKSSRYELLDQSALTAVKQWKFIPAKKGDVAIPLWVNIPIKFQLQ
jgi:TonB family protein